MVLDRRTTWRDARNVRRRGAAVMLACIALLTAPLAVAPTALAVAPPLTVGREAWVAVSVATLWHTPGSARAVDSPALTNPVGIRQWLSRMTLTDRRGLNGRADTQALLGDRVIVVARSGSWVKVVVPEQPTPLDARGYPGWMPAVQLTAVRPVASTSVVTVVARTTYLRTDNVSATPVTEISFGTRLPRVGMTGAWVRVATPTGRVLRLAAGVVAVRAPSAAALPKTGSDVVRAAQMFNGLPYLWAGRSGFGFDCSGLTSLVLRAHDVIIPRDADAQAAKGTKVSSSAPGQAICSSTPLVGTFTTCRSMPATAAWCSHRGRAAPCRRSRCQPRRTLASFPVPGGMSDDEPRQLEHRGDRNRWATSEFGRRIGDLSPALSRRSGPAAGSDS